MKFDWKSARHEIGGQYFLELRSLGVVALYLLSTSVLSNFLQLARTDAGVTNTPSLIALLVLVNLGAFLACFMLIVGLNFTVLRNKSITGTNIVVVVVVSFLIGALKGQVVSWLGIALKLFDGSAESETLRWLQTGLLGAFLLPFFAQSLHKMHRVSDYRDLLLAERVQRLSVTGAKREFRSNRAIDAIKESCLEEIARLERQVLRTPENAKLLISKSIENLIENQVRPLSHQLWKAHGSVGNSLGYRWQLSQATSTRVQGFAVSTFLIFFILLMGHLQTQSFEQSLISALTITCAVSATATWHLMVSQKRPVVRLAVMIGSVLLGSAFSVFLNQLISKAEPNPTDIALVFVIFLTSLQNYFLTNTAHAIFKEDREIRAQVEKLIGNRALDLEAQKVIAAIESRDLAQHLHSEVQNRLISTALALDTGPEESPQLAIEQLRQVIDRISPDTFPSNFVKVEELGEELNSRWEGFLDIQIDWNEVSSELILPRVIYEVFQEAVGNARKHGLASKVHITLASPASDDSTLEVRVRDNGLGPRKGKIGLGLKLLDAVSAGDWSLTASQEGGSILSFRLQLNNLQ